MEVVLYIHSLSFSIELVYQLVQSIFREYIISARNNSWLLAIFWPISTFGWPKSILVGQFYCTFSMGWQSITLEIIQLSYLQKNNWIISDPYFYHCIIWGIFRPNLFWSDFLKLQYNGKHSVVCVDDIIVAGITLLWSCVNSLTKWLLFDV